VLYKDTFLCYFVQEYRITFTLQQKWSDSRLDGRRALRGYSKVIELVTSKYISAHHRAKNVVIAIQIN